MDFTFKAFLLPTFIENLMKTNKKLAKYGKEATIVNTKTFSLIDKNNRTQNMVTIAVEAPQVAHNGKDVKYVGTVAIKDGVKEIFSADESVVLGNEELRCDHCKINRYRVKFFFFVEGGKVLCIGSSCAKDYFGWDVERVLDAFNNGMASFDAEDEGEGKKKRWNRDFGMKDLIVATYMATENFRKAWVSKAKAEINGSMSTGKAVFGILTPLKHETDIIDAFKATYETLKDQIDSMVDTLTAKWNIPPTNDFEYNIVNNLFYTEGGDLREFVVSPGIVAYAIYSTFHKDEQVEGTKSEFVATEGERITATVTVKNVKGFDGQYGISYLVTMTTPEGNVLKTFASGDFGNVEVGQTLTIKGTVKKHDLYKGNKETMLSRVVAK